MECPMPSLMDNECWNSKNYQISGIRHETKGCCPAWWFSPHPKYILYQNSRMILWKQNHCKRLIFQNTKDKENASEWKKLSLLITHNNVWSQGNWIHLHLDCLINVWSIVVLVCRKSVLSEASPSLNCIILQRNHLLFFLSLWMTIRVFL